MAEDNRDMLRVFHIDPEKSWRGGQRQVGYLHEGLLRRGYASWVVCRPGYPFEAWLKQKNMPFLPVPMRNEADFLSGRAIALEAKKRDVSILHLHSSHALSLGLWASFFAPELKLIGVRRVALPIKKSQLSRFKYTSKRISCHVAISEAIREIMIADGIDSNCIKTIHSGIDIGRMQTSSTPDDYGIEGVFSKGRIVVGIVAALTREKGYHTLIDAASKVLKRHDNVVFCAVGDGADRTSLEELVKNYGIEKSFHFVGFQKDVGAFLNAFDIFVLPSKNEGLGTSILDAQSVGLPVLASGVGGIPEVIDDGVNGILASSGDVDGFAESLNQLIENETLRKRLGKNALASVKNFSIEKTVDKTIDLYHEVLATQ